MPEFTVSWVIDVEADTHEEAARKARKIQLGRDSIADVFEVAPFMPGVETRVIDLSELDGRSADEPEGMKLSPHISAVITAAHTAAAATR